MTGNRTTRFVLNYFWGNMICSFASLISFPVFTRVFSVSNYGVLALVFSTLTIVNVFSKMGMQNSIVRFYPEYSTGCGEREKEFFSTYFYSMIAIGVLALMAFVILVPFLTDNLLSLQNRMPFYAAALFIPAHAITSFVGNIFRARQEPVAFNIVLILETYLTLLCGISFLFLFGATVTNFFLGGILGKIVYLAYYTVRMKNDHELSVTAVSNDLFSKAFWYGFPLMLLELAGTLLAYGDRFIIKYYLDTTDVAIYAVGYNLSMYMANAFTGPINSAVQVEYMTIWSKEGKEPTEAYLSKTFKAIMYFGLIFCIVMILNFEYVILLFASRKYLGSIAIAPYVIFGVMVYSLYPVFGAGIFISKKTKNLFYTVSLALLLNFFANVLLVPKVGILGAAIATVGANVFAALLIFLVAGRFLRIRVSAAHVLLCLIAGGIAYLLVRQVEFSSMALNVVTRTVSSVVLYSAIIMLFDREFSGYCRKLYASVASRAAAT